MRPFIAATAWLLAFGLFAQSAVNDPAFNPGDIGFGAGAGFYEPWFGGNGTGNCMLVQPDNKVLVGGGWGPEDLWLSRKLVRLNTNGSIEQAFITGTGFNGPVLCLALQADGKILVGGAFTSFSGTACNNICRLNSNGTLDATFSAVPGCDGAVRRILLVPGNLIMLGGDFTSVNATPRNKLARVDLNGVADPTFNLGGSGVVGQVRAMALQPDGRVIVGGLLSSYNGIARSNLFRVLANGSLDGSYMSTAGAGADGAVNDIVMAGAAHLAAGAFLNVNGTFRSGLVKLSAAGSIVTTYAPPVGSFGEFTQVVALTGGATLEVRRALIGFSNSQYLVASHSVTGVADGSLATGIENSATAAIGGYGEQFGAGAVGCLVAEAPSGAIYVLGESCNRGLLRFASDGSLDPSFNCGYGLLGSSSRSPARNVHLPAIELCNADALWVGCAVQDGTGLMRGPTIRNANGGLASGWPPSTLPVSYEAFYAMSGNTSGGLAVSHAQRTYEVLDATGNHTGVFNSTGLIPRYSTGRNALVWYGDGRVLVGGAENVTPDPDPAVLSRYLIDGVLDPSFTEPLAATGAERVETVALATSGRIYIAGTFSSINGNARGRIARLLSNGALDLTFDPLGGFNDTVRDILEQPDGKVLCTGDFTTYRGSSAPGICRLNADATLDPTFNAGTGLNGEGWKLLRRSDGLIYASGRFTHYNGAPRGSLVAINSDGSVNTGFDTGAGFRDNAGNAALVNDMVLQSTGQIVAVGEFTQYQGIGRNRIARIGTAGAMRLAARVHLGGSWNGTDMNDALRVNGLLPLSEPYRGLGYQHSGGGNEIIAPSLLVQQGNNAVVDWVVLELRHVTAPAVVSYSRSALLQRDGDVVDTDGAGPVILYASPGAYFVALRHRNHLGVMTATPVTLGGQTTAVDFTASGTATFGTDALRIQNGVRTMWSGDVVGNGLLQYTGAGNDRDPILVSVGGNTPNNTVAGYLQADVNMDGLVKYTGAGNDRDPILVNVGSITPNSIRSAQLP